MLGYLGVILGHLGAILVHLGAILRQLGDKMRPKSAKTSETDRKAGFWEDFEEPLAFKPDFAWNRKAHSTPELYLSITAAKT